MNPIEQENLIVLFNIGDADAFEIIYQRLSPDLFSYARRFIQNWEETEDIVAESFLKLWSLRGDFESLQKIISFLHVSTKNACLDHIRHKKMERLRKTEILEAILGTYEQSETMDVVTEHLLKRIYAEMEKLPKKSRTVLKLFFLENLKNPEIAKRLGTNEKTIRNQKVNALKRLRINLLGTINHSSMRKSFRNNTDYNSPQLEF